MVAGMNCFPCFTSQKSKKSHSKREHGATPQENVIAKPPDMKKQRPEEANQVDAASINAKHFTFRELATATKNFRQECLLCEAGFGRVYKGIIPATGQAVAVKQFDRNGMHGSKEFLAEVYTLSLLHHENIVNFIGYCADGDQRLLVYDYVQGATLEDHLLATNADQPPLDWYTRMKVAAGVARGLEYLHDSANPPIIFKDLKPSDILLDTDHNAKLFDFGLGNHSTGDKMSPAPARVMGTYGYCAPEYVRTGQLTLKSDVYSFGVVLLELITGRRAVDTTRPHEEQNLVSWAQPLFRDPKRYPDMADPLLNKSFPEKDLNQAVAIAAMCLQEEAEARPLMSDVVTALSFLSMVHPEAPPAPLPHATSVSKESAAGQGNSESESEIESGSESECESQSGSESASSYSRSSRRSSRRSRKGAYYSGSECGSACSSYRGSSKHHGEISQKKTCRKSSSRELSQKSSKKISTKELSEKSSKKSSSADKELSQKSSRKSFIGGLGHKSSRKSSVRILSHKSTTSMGSQDGSFSMSRNSSSVVSDDEYERCSSRMLSRRNISFGLISSGSVNSSRRSVEEGSMCSSMRSDEGSGHHYDRTSSSSGSHRGIVHSR